MNLLDWNDIGRVILSGTIAYVAFVVLQRVTGKRTLSKLNAFDLVVTVAFGSALATVFLNAETPLVSGIVAFALLVVLQYVATSLSVRFRPFAHALKSDPIVLVRNGEFLEDVAHGQRVMEEEVFQAVRERGYGSLEEIGAVILETNGELSVIPRSQLGDGSALQNLKDTRAPGDESATGA